jgi:hypothetical protein
LKLKLVVDIEDKDETVRLLPSAAAAAAAAAVDFIS